MQLTAQGWNSSRPRKRRSKFILSLWCKWRIQFSDFHELLK